MVAVLLEEAEKALAADDLDAAERAFLGVLEQDPLNAVARLALAEIRRSSPAALEPSGRVRLAVPVAALIGRVTNPDEAFVLSRLAAGSMPVDHLLQLCPMAEPQVLAILERYATEKLVIVER